MLQLVQLNRLPDLKHPPEFSYKKGVLKNFQNFIEKPLLESLFNTVTGLQVTLRTLMFKNTYFEDSANDCFFTVLF